MQDQIDFSSPSTYIRIESDDEDDGDIIDDGGYDSNSICPSSTSSGVVVARGSAPPDETEEFLRAARARLHPLNVLNVAAFGANVFVSLGIGIWGLGGVMSSVREVTKSHMVRARGSRYAF